MLDAKGHKPLPLSPISNYDQLTDEMKELRKKTIEEDGIIITNAKYKRQYFGYNELPKSILHAHAGRNKIPLPTYETIREERLFRSIITFQGIRYTSLLFEKHAKHAEQNAAMVCCYHLGLIDKEFLRNLGMLFDDPLSVEI